MPGPREPVSILYELSRSAAARLARRLRARRLRRQRASASTAEVNDRERLRPNDRERTARLTNERPQVLGELVVDGADHDLHRLALHQVLRSPYGSKTLSGS
jgi:hypothetical protein